MDDKGFYYYFNIPVAIFSAGIFIILSAYFYKPKLQFTFTLYIRDSSLRMANLFLCIFLGRYFSKDCREDRKNNRK